MYPTIRRLTENYNMTEYKYLCDELSAFVHENCKPWLKAIGNDLSVRIYRGTDKNVDTDKLFTVSETREDRHALGMKKEDRDILQRYIVDAGKVANRVNSIPVTSHRAHASAFGRMYVVLPIGEFNYTWFEGITDFNEWLWHSDTMTAGNIFGARTPETQERWESGMMPFNIHGDDNTLKAAIDERAEILLRPAQRQYILVRPEDYAQIVNPAEEQVSPPSFFRD